MTSNRPWQPREPALHQGGLGQGALGPMGEWSFGWERGAGPGCQALWDAAVLSLLALEAREQPSPLGPRPVLVSTAWGPVPCGGWWEAWGPEVV